ncbi:MAG: hypothetical protein Q9216_005888 [Gyalolechia sp. 2 TL-2023]
MSSLVEIRTWLDRNPYDVVTILLVNADNAAASDLDAQFEAAAIRPYAYTPESYSWPTLDELIVSGTRLLTFVADIAPSATAPYLMNEFTYIFENPFSVLSLSNFSCIPERPASVQGQTSAAVQSGRLPLMNHFLNVGQGFGIQIPDIDNITITNAASGPTGNLGDAATACTAAYGRPPSFIMVDFFQHGSAIDTVDRLNGISPVGRVTAPVPAGGIASSGAMGHAGRLGSSFIAFHGLSIILTITIIFSSMV